MYYCFSKECGEVLEEWTKENLLIIGWGGFSFSVVQVYTGNFVYINR